MKRTLLAAAAALAVSGGAALAAQLGASPMVVAGAQTPTPMPETFPGERAYVTNYAAFPLGKPLGEPTMRGQDGTIRRFAPSDARN
jgi:hypothetical protein